MVVKAPSGRGDQRRPTTPAESGSASHAQCSIAPLVNPHSQLVFLTVVMGPLTGESVGCRLCSVLDGNAQIGQQTPGTLRHVPPSPLPRGRTWEEEFLPWKCPFCSWSMFSPWTPRGPPTPGPQWRTQPCLAAAGRLLRRR